MTQFISGMIVAGYLIAGLFFTRFWHETRDRLFLMFAIAFGALAAQRALLAFWPTGQTGAFLYTLRAFAFLLIIAAIIDKNRPDVRE